MKKKGSFQKHGERAEKNIFQTPDSKVSKKRRFIFVASTYNVIWCVLLSIFGSFFLHCFFFFCVFFYTFFLVAFAFVLHFFLLLLFLSHFFHTFFWVGFAFFLLFLLFLRFPVEACNKFIKLSMHSVKSQS